MFSVPVGSFTHKCNVCIKDININNIEGRVDLKVTFSQQNTQHIYIYI
jgi:hypothetical protein